MSVFAPDLDRAALASALAAGYDPADPWSRVPPTAAPSRSPGRIGVPDPDQLTFDGDPNGAARFAAAVDGLAGTVVDIGPFLAAGDLLYGGSMVAERYEAVGPFVDAHPGEVDPIVGTIISASADVPAWKVFRDRTELARLARLARLAAPTWDAVDVLVLPTVPRIPTVAEVHAEPIGVNSMLGTYTNFVNLLDLCALTIPIGSATAAGPPTSVTLIAPACAMTSWSAWRRRLVRPPASVAGDVGRPVDGHRLTHELGDVGPIGEQDAGDAERRGDLVDERPERRRVEVPHLDLERAGPIDSAKRTRAGLGGSVGSA